MTMEQRIEALEQELAKLKSRPAGQTRSEYAKASSSCKAYFAEIKRPAQNYGALFECERIARTAFKEKNIAQNRRAQPNRYISTPEEGTEYFELFKAFLTVYQGYLERSDESDLQRQASE